MTADKFREIKFNFRHSDLMVRFNSIHQDPKNPRIGTDPDADQTLQESVLENGLNMLIVIAKTDKKDQYIIVFGHRRYDIFVEAGYKTTNPLIPCTVITPFDDPDRPLTDDDIFDYRNSDEDYQSKLSFHERIVNIFQKTEEKMDAGWNLTRIADEVFHRTLPWLSNNLKAFKSPTVRKAIEDGEITSMDQAWNLLGIDAEAQETLVEAKKDIKATGMEKVAKLIRTAPQEAQKPLLDATKDMSLHDIERVVKQVNMGVTIAEAVRAVELSKTEAPQEDEEKAKDGKLQVDEEEDEAHKKKQVSSSSETSGIIGKAFAGHTGEEKGTEEPKPDPSVTPTPSPPPEEGVEATPVIDPSLETEKPKAEEKKKEPQVCAKAGQVEEMLQKFVKIPPKTFLARFKTVAHKGNFKNRVEGIHLWSGELSDRMESDLNGDSLFVCEVNRKRNALLEILARPKHSIVESEREKFDDLMNELKTKIEQDAMSRR